LPGRGERPFVGWLARFTTKFAAASVINVGTTAAPSIFRIDFLNAIDEVLDALIELH
jgi:hypothetical protein